MTRTTNRYIYLVFGGELSLMIVLLVKKSLLCLYNEDSQVKIRVQILLLIHSRSSFQRWAGLLEQCWSIRQNYRSIGSLLYIFCLVKQYKLCRFLVTVTMGNDKCRSNQNQNKRTGILSVTSAKGSVTRFPTFWIFLLSHLIQEKKKG